MTAPLLPTSARWQFWIDRGGTFTDIVARRPDGGLVTHKLLSDNPEHYADAALQGIRELLGVPANQPIPAERIAAVKMGTTVATNALLERKGDRTLLLITQGFRDALRIGYQNRPKLFARQIVLPELLYERVAEVAERVSAQGEIIVPFDPESAREPLAEAYRAGIRAVAITFMHGYRYPEHEKQAAELAREIGFTQISVSHQVSPLMKLVGRGDTTVVDAYLSPILRRYVDRVAGELGGVRLLFMQSSGGLADARHFHGKDSILSGPAGGIVGAARTATQAGLDRIITFDMGGTSTDVAHYAGEYERAFETQVAGVRLRAPMLHIHTVAAGGGSICRFDGSRLRVGPESAGAHPGPACYRRGGPLTVTDCNVLLGRIQPDFFPKVFGPDQNQPLDREVVIQRFEALAARVCACHRQGVHPRRTGRRFSPHRGREHGQCDQTDFHPARLRRDRIHAVLFRRRGWPTRLRGGRRAGNAGDLHSSVGRSAVGLRHGLGRCPAAQGTRGGSAAGGGTVATDGANLRRTGAGGAERRCRRRTFPPGRFEPSAPFACATPAATAL